MELLTAFASPLPARLLALRGPGSELCLRGVPTPSSSVLKQGSILGPSRVSAPPSLPGQTALAQALPGSICVPSPGCRLARKTLAEHRES